MGHLLTGLPLVAGAARGAVLASSEPISFWGGWDPRTGEIIDRRHPLSGRNGAGTVLAIPFTRGSSTTTAILLESVRSGTAPVAVLCTSADPFLVLASVVAAELYGAVLPIVVLEGSDMVLLAAATEAVVEVSGRVRLLGDGGASREADRP